MPYAAMPPQKPFTKLKLKEKKISYTFRASGMKNEFTLCIYFSHKRWKRMNEQQKIQKLFYLSASHFQRGFVTKWLSILVVYFFFLRISSWHVPRHMTTTFQMMMMLRFKQQTYTYCQSPTLDDCATRLFHWQKPLNAYTFFTSFIGLLILFSLLKYKSRDEVEMEAHGWTEFLAAMTTICKRSIVVLFHKCSHDIVDCREFDAMWRFCLRGDFVHWTGKWKYINEINRFHTIRSKLKRMCRCDLSSATSRVCMNWHSKMIENFLMMKNRTPHKNIKINFCASDKYVIKFQKNNYQLVGPENSISRNSIIKPGKKYIYTETQRNRDDLQAKKEKKCVE